MNIKPKEFFKNRAVKATMWLLASFIVYFMFMATTSGKLFTHDFGYTYSKSYENGPLIEYRENGEILTSAERHRYEAVTDTIAFVLGSMTIFTLWMFNSQIFRNRLYVLIFTLAFLPIYYVVGGSIGFVLWYEF